MKRTTFSVSLRGGESLEVSGYAAEVEGIPVVIHRRVKEDRTLADAGWKVSEPVTGMAIPDSEGTSREAALEYAAASIRRHGAEKVRELIADRDRTVAQQDRFETRLARQAREIRDGIKRHGTIAA